MIRIKDTTIKKKFALAAENYQKNNFDIAKDLYIQILKIDQNHILALSNLGVIFEILEDHKKAMSCYQRAIEINPNIAETHSNLGVVFNKLEENQKAIASYQRAIEINPNFTDAHNNLGALFNKLEEDQKAIASYQRAIEINPNLVDTHNNLGKIFLKLEDQKAIAYFERAIEINPNLADSHNNLGVAFKTLGEDQKAKNCFERAIKINPNLADLHNNLGTIFTKLGENQKAKKNYERAIEINPNFVEAHHNLAITYGQIGNDIKSVEHYRKALINKSEINFEIDKEKDQKLQPATSAFFIELTNKCNFHCEFCPSDSQTRLHGFMELSLVKKIFDEISQKKIVTEVALHLMGEPTLHPKLNEILAYAKSKNVKICLTTNGSTMVKKRVPTLLNSISGQIVASLMTPTKETYKTRGDVRLSWDRYIGNFQLLIEEHLKKILRGDKIEYEITFRVMVSSGDQKGIVKILDSSKSLQENYEEWSNFTKNVEIELGLTPFSRQKIDSSKTFFLLGNGARELSFYLQKNIKIQFWRAYTFANTRVDDTYKLVANEKTQFCPHPFTDFGVLWNGDVSLCCLDYDATLKVGNIKNHSVEEVMKSSDSKKLRASMYGSEELHPTCIKCQSRAVER